MKRVMSVLLVLMILISCCACGNSEEEIRGQIVPNTPAQPEATEPAPAFSMGKAEGGTYTNDFLGMSCTLPEQWSFYTDEQILELNNMASQSMDEDVLEQLQEAAIVYDMFAVDQTDNSNVSVNMEKLNVLQLANLDMKAVLEAQIPAIQSAYANMGYTDVQVAYQKATVDGKEYDALTIHAKIQGIDFHSTSFAYLKVNYIVNVSVCAFSEEKVEQVLSYFTVA